MRAVRLEGEGDPNEEDRERGRLAVSEGGKDSEVYRMRNMAAVRIKGGWRGR